MESKVDSFTVIWDATFTSKIFDAICEVLVYCPDTTQNCNDPMHHIYCFCFTLKKFCGLKSFVSIPESFRDLSLMAILMEIFLR